MQPLLRQKYGKGKFELVEVPDMAAAGAFDGVVKGASGFIHVATPVMQSYDPNVGVPMVVNGILHVLQACAKEPGIKRVVMTSSSTAAASPRPNKVFTMDEKTWNTEAVEAAWAPPPYDVKGKRLFSFAYPYTWNDILAIFRKLYPQKKFIDDIPDLGQDLSEVANDRAEELVKRMGRPGWASLEESVRAVTDTIM